MPEIFQCRTPPPVVDVETLVLRPNPAGMVTANLAGVQADNVSVNSSLASAQQELRLPVEGGLAQGSSHVGEETPA